VYQRAAIIRKRMNQGTIIWLNGPSSVGKSSIARALQSMLEVPCLHTGLDHFLGSLPASFFTPSDGVHPASADGYVLVFRDSPASAAGSAPDASHQPETGAFIPGGKILGEVRLGPGAMRVLTGMYQAMAAYASAGNWVIVDDVIYDRRVLQAGVEAFAALPVLFVGLRCPLEILERRERERGDRGPGGAAAFYPLVHADALYDLELDTSQLSQAACAERIKAALEPGQPRTAVRELQRLLNG
jgi:chloramphenicol 3-O phosphotransferase